jgi:hypothetical protein
MGSDELPEMAHLCGTSALTTTPLPLLKAAHTIPGQAGQIFNLANARMSALWHLDIGTGVDRVLEEVGAHHDGATVVSQDSRSSTSPRTRSSPARRMWTTRPRPRPCTALPSMNPVWKNQSPRPSGSPTPSLTSELLTRLAPMRSLIH